MSRYRMTEGGLIAAAVIIVTLIVVILFFVSCIAHELASPKQSNGLVIFVDECVSEGYTVSQCCWAWEDAMEFGSVQLEMPKKWA